MERTAHETGTTWDEPDPEGQEAEKEASLLVALLIKYPEIGSVKIMPAAKTLRLTFLLRSAPAEETVVFFKRRLERFLAALSMLSGSKQTGSVVVHTKTYENLGHLHVDRPLGSVQFEEISVVSSLVSETFGASLIVEGSTDNVNDVADASWDDLSDFAARSQDEWHDHMLAHGFEYIKRAKAEMLIGFRDGDRVLVFNQPALSPH